MEYYVSPLQLRKICGFIDSQGISLSDNSASPYYFIPLELSFVGDNGNVHFIYTINTTDKCNPSLQKSIKAQGSSKTGFKFQNTECKTSSVEKFFSHLNFIIEAFTTTDKPYIAVRNPKLAHYLRVSKVKFIDFNSPFFNVPTLIQLDKQYSSTFCCEIHQECADCVYICSKRKANNYFSWIKEIHNSGHV